MNYKPLLIYITIVCITETWYKECIGDESVSLYGYNLERKDILHGRAGGVACYVRNDVLYKRLGSLVEVGNWRLFGFISRQRNCLERFRVH